MAREFFDHTGDIGVTLTGDTLEVLFRDAALALTETMTELPTVRATAAQPVHMVAPALDDLLVDWLEELLYRFEVRNLLVADVDMRIFQEPDPPGGWRLDGTLHGEPADPERHPAKLLIKGITYHRLHVHRSGGRWETAVVFDI